MTPEQTKRLEKLRDALSKVQYHMGDDEVNDAAVYIHKAAQDFADIFETLCALDEAGEKAIGGTWSQYEGLSVFAKYHEDGIEWDTKVLDIRGWGHLTGNGHARGLSHDDAKDIQVNNAEFITNAANARPQIAKAVR